MCGISGVYRVEGQLTKDDVLAVDRMVTALKPRGPDSDSIWLDPQNHCVLGHTRLAILDRSEAGRQPMSNADGSVVITYNGEVYNYKDLRYELGTLGHVFRSQTDTEVLIYGYLQWGMEGLVSRLRGMFAFAIYDVLQRTLYLVRDRLGIKPLYFRHICDGVAFASTVKALLATSWPVTEDPEALVSFLRWGSITNLRTTVKEIGIVPPGMCLRFTEHPSYWPYWNVEDFLPTDTQIDVREVREMLTDVVSRHLQSDVPVGVFLSGGVDSSVLAKLSGCRGLNISFPRNTEYNEYHYADQVASCITRFQYRHDLVTEWSDFIKAMDQPSIDGMNTYLVSKLAREQKFPVALSGLGADELFAGYRHLQVSHRYGWTHLVPARLGYLRYRSVFKPWEIWGVVNDDEPATRYQSASGSLAAKWTLWDFTHYLHDQLLRDTDWASMAHGVEVRVPYLDHKLVEAILPVSMKLKCKSHKYLLIEAMKDLLPRAVWDRPKQGFELPFARWLKEDADHWQEIAMENTPLKRKGVEWFWKQFRRGKVHWSRVWATVIASQWKRWC